MKPDDLYIGLMSGTSLDAIDSVIAKFGDAQSDTAVELIAARLHPFPEKIRSRLLRVIDDFASTAPDELNRLDDELGHIYADAVKIFFEPVMVVCQDSDPERVWQPFE